MSAESPPVGEAGAAPAPPQTEVDHDYCVGYCKRKVDPAYQDAIRLMCIAIGSSKHQSTVFKNFANAHMSHEEDVIKQLYDYIYEMRDLQVEVQAHRKLSDKEITQTVNQINKDYDQKYDELDKRKENLEKVRYARDAMEYTTASLIAAISAPVKFGGEVMEPCYSDGTPWSAHPENFPPPKMPDYLTKIRLKQKEEEETTMQALKTMKMKYDTLLNNNKMMEKKFLADSVLMKQKDEVIVELEKKIDELQKGKEAEPPGDHTLDLGYSFMKDVIYHSHAAIDYQDKLFHEMSQIFTAGQYHKIDELHYYSETVKALRLKWIDKKPLAEKKELMEPIDKEYNQNQQNLTLLKMIRSKFDVMRDCYEKYKEFVNVKTNCSLPKEQDLEEFDKILIATEQEKILKMSLEECQHAYLNMLRDAELVRGRNEVLCIAKHESEEENRKLRIDMAGLDREIELTNKKFDAARKRMMILENVNDGRQLQIYQMEKQHAKEVEELKERIEEMEKTIVEGKDREKLMEILGENPSEFSTKEEMKELTKQWADWKMEMKERNIATSPASSQEATILDLRKKLRQANERLDLKSETYFMLCDVYCDSVNALCDQRLDDAKGSLIFKQTTLAQTPGIPERKQLEKVIEQEYDKQVEKIEMQRECCMMKKADWDARRKKIMEKSKDSESGDSESPDAEDTHEWSAEFRELKKQYYETIKIRYALEKKLKDFEAEIFDTEKEFRAIFRDDGAPKKDLANFAEILKQNEKVDMALTSRAQRKKEIDAKLAETEKCMQAVKEQREAALHRHTCSGEADKDVKIAELRSKLGAQSQKLKASSKEIGDLSMKQKKTEATVAELQKNLALFKKAATGAEDGLSDVERIAALEQKVEEMNQKLERARRESAEKDRQMAIVETGYLTRNGIVRVQISAGRM